MRGSAAFRTGVAPGGALAPGWVKNELWRRARAVPSLDLRFAENKSLVDATTGASLVTFTRASSGTFVGSDGVLRTAVTNFALNTVWAGGTTPTSWALAGTPDTPTIVSSTLGSADGAIALSFTSSASRGYLTQTVALAANATYVFSVYVEAISGYASGSNNVISLNNGPAGSTITGAVGTPVVGGRIFCSIANGATAGNVQLRVGLGVGSNATGTIILSRPQLEQSTTVGEYIPTTSVINSAPRFDHNPTTGESLGLLVEEARTNSIRNNTGVGAVAGTPGTLPTNWTQSNNTGLAAKVVGTGTENGITYIDLRVNGTTTGTGQTNIVLETSIGVAATTGQTWSLSSYLKIQAGSLTNVSAINLVLQEKTAVGTAVTVGAQAITIPTSSLGTYRPTFTRTLSGGVTVAAVMPYIQININTGLVVDFTLRIGLPQLELGAFATSPILTSTAAATRSADVASIGSSAFSGWFSPSLTDHTFYVDAVIRNAQANGQILEGFQALDLQGVTISLDGIGTRPRVLQRHGASRLDTSGNYPLWSAGVPVKIAVNTSSASQTASNGAFPPTLGSAPAQVDWTSSSGISIGSRTVGSAGFFNNHIRRIVFWSQPLPGSTLQQITQP